MGKYIRKADRIDHERGDVLTIRQHEIKSLYAENFPQETRRDILDAYIGWFAGNELKSLDGPLENAFLMRMVETQKENVRDYLRICDNKTQGDSSQLKSTQVKSSQLKANTNNKHEQEKDTNSLFSCSVREDKGALDAPLASPDSVLSKEDAVKELMTIAPPIDSKHYNIEDLEFYEDNHNDIDDVSVIDELVKDFERDGATNVREPLERYLEVLGEDLFRRAWFRFDTDVYKAKVDEKPFDKPAGVFFSRLKRLKTATEKLNI